ncbi:MAG: ATP-dependent Clp protease proteolytic subunit [Opitutales bacterium]|nr:ATP-dependent Clp protease proteolytic subunit [Opitutales bacterium]
MFGNPRMDGDDGKKQDKAPPLSELMQRKFLEERKIFFWGEVSDKSARTATEQLLYLEYMDPGKEITMYLNSPGGSITAGMAVYDTMKLVTSEIRVVVVGLAASMGSVFLCGGAKGKRLLYPHSRVLIHQPLIMGTMRGAAVDIHIQAQEMEKLREEMNHILAGASGQPLDRIRKDTDRDFYLNAKEAIEYGLADAIVEKVV